MQELEAKKFYQKMKEGLLVDVRERSELASGKIAGATNIPLSELDKHDLKKTGEIFFYCSRGQRSLLAGKNYPNSYSLRGGLEAWIKEDLPLESSLPAGESHHYSRQILLPEISLAGQEKIRKARVLLVGAGGLGSPAALYLTGAGIGTIGIIDDDQVEISNLPRQILFRPDQNGKKKAQVAKENLQAMNPDTEVISYSERLGRENILDIIKDFDLILDGADNFPTRYLLNDASKRLKIPLVSASILGFQGQISTFLPEGPCYRCIWPEPPPAQFAPSCSEAGILGTVSGIFGLLQANEALKIIADFGTTLSGQLLLVDLADNSWHSLKIKQKKDCPVCLGQEKELPDYDLFCAIA